MPVINIHDAKTHFSRYVEEAARGGEIVIARAGRPVARLVPYGQPPSRRPGVLAGRVVIAEDFDAPLASDVLDAFEGRS